MWGFPLLVELLTRIMVLIADVGGSEQTIQIFEAIIKFFSGGA